MKRLIEVLLVTFFAAASYGTAPNTTAVHPAKPLANDWSSGVYDYDASGNIKAIGTDRYAYDAVSRVVSAPASRHPGLGQYFTHDSFGNMLSVQKWGQSAVTYAVDSATNRVNASGTYNIYAQYDAAGNVLSISPDSANTYDAVGMMTRFRGQTYYLYTADDERIASVSSDGAHYSWTLRDPNEKVLREYDETRSGNTSTWTWKRDYVYRDGTLFAAITPSGTQHYHVDHLGSPRLITDSGRAKKYAYDYYAFGEDAAFNVGDPEAMHFTGHERDYNGGTGAANTNYLDYMHARFYSANLGRFLSVDPTWDSADLKTPQSWNRYSYVRNNPIGNTDPDGKICIPCAAVGAFVAVGYESYRQVRSGEPVNNARLLAAVGIGAAAGATLGAAAEAAPVLYNAALANPAAVATGTAIVGGALTPGPESLTGGFEQATVKLAGELNYTKTAAASLSQAGREVPGMTIAGAILSGERAADPQGAKGAIQITQDVYKYARRLDKETGQVVWTQVKYQLRIIYNEAEKLVMHANIKEVKQ